MRHMTTPTLPTAAAAPQPGQRSAGIVLTVLGLAGHLYAAAAMCGFESEVVLATAPSKEFVQ